MDDGARVMVHRVVHWVMVHRVIHCVRVPWDGSPGDGTLDGTLGEDTSRVVHRVIVPFGGPLGDGALGWFTK